MAGIGKRHHAIEEARRIDEIHTYIYEAITDHTKTEAEVQEKIKSFDLNIAFPIAIAIILANLPQYDVTDREFISHENVKFILKCFFDCHADFTRHEDALPNAPRNINKAAQMKFLNLYDAYKRAQNPDEDPFNAAVPGEIFYDDDDTEYLLTIDDSKTDDSAPAAAGAGRAHASPEIIITPPAVAVAAAVAPTSLAMGSMRLKYTPEPLSTANPLCY